MKSKRSIFALSVLAAGGMSCMQKDLLSPTTETPISVSGGIARSPDGALTLTFGTGDLSANAVIRIEESRDLTPPWKLTPTYRVTANGGTLRGTPTIAIRVNAQLDLETQRPFLAEVSNTPSTVIHSGTFDSAASTMSGSIGTLGKFAVIVQSTACQNVECGASCGSTQACDLNGLCVNAQTPNLCNADPDAGVNVNNGICQVDASLPFSNNVRIAPCIIDEVEPNDTPATAHAVLDTLDEAVDIVAQFDGNDDNYRFSIPANTWGSLLAVTFTEPDNYSTCTPGLNLGLTVTDEFGRQVVTVGPDRCPYLNYYDKQNVDGLWPGTFTITVHGPAPANGPMLYHLAIYLLSPISAPQNSDGGINPRDSGY